jgi:Acetyltransferase (GNAT) domain
MVYTINPLQDPRWAEFLSRHESASVFHSPQWLEAVRRTYGYTPVVFTTTPPSSPLSNGIVFCEVKSWLTGRRMVSVPFSDHCEPLLDTSTAAAELIAELKKSVDSGKWKYVELRPMTDFSTLDGVVKSPACYFHLLDIQPALEEVFRRTHKTSIQQPIKRAERVGITYECGRSERLLAEFYRLLLLTRRKHQIPPQPIEWFRNLVDCMGDALQIRVAFKDGVAVASIITLMYKDVIVYKYGSSDAAFQNLGGTPFLLWNAIVDAKAAGLKAMDFGRSDADNPGLIGFKDRWGATSSMLTYLRWSRTPDAEAVPGRSSGLAKRVFAMMPDSLLEMTGRILYRHVG